jgi:hypothetical protein
VTKWRRFTNSVFEFTITQIIGALKLLCPLASTTPAYNVKRHDW